MKKERQVKLHQGLSVAQDKKPWRENTLVSVIWAEEVRGVQEEANSLLYNHILQIGQHPEKPFTEYEG